MEWRTSSTKHAIQITLIYFTISVGWIFFSDRLLEAALSDSHNMVQLQTYKGWFFVLITSILLFYLIRRSTFSIIESRDKAEETLREKQQVLSELHHRVKNNLALISSLIHLQVNSLDKSEAIPLVETQYRIFALAEIEELLYQNKDLSRVPFHEYVKQVSIKIEEEIKNTSFEVQVDELYLNIDQAIPFGLLLNEVLTQLRFIESKGQRVIFNLTSSSSKEVLLELRFEGVPPAIFASLKEEKNVEKILMEQYIKQLDASANWLQEKESILFKLNFEKTQTRQIS